jgi:hypothetical protein
VARRRYEIQAINVTNGRKSSTPRFTGPPANIGTCLIGNQLNVPYRQEGVDKASISSKENESRADDFKPAKILTFVLEGKLTGRVIEYLIGSVG